MTSTTVPQEASKRSYEILNSQGRVIDEIAPAPTAEEIARREAVRALHRKIRELEDLNRLKQGNISVIKSQLDFLEQEIASQNQEIEALKETYGSDIRRLERVTGNTRTLSLDPSRKSSAD